MKFLRILEMSRHFILSAALLLAHSAFTAASSFSVQILLEGENNGKYYFLGQSLVLKSPLSNDDSLNVQPLNLYEAAAYETTYAGALRMPGFWLADHAGLEDDRFQLAFAGPSMIKEPYLGFDTNYDKFLVVDKGSFGKGLPLKHVNFKATTAAGRGAGRSVITPLSPGSENVIPLYVCEQGEHAPRIIRTTPKSGEKCRKVSHLITNTAILPEPAPFANVAREHELTSQESSNDMHMDEGIASRLEKETGSKTLSSLIANGRRSEEDLNAKRMHIPSENGDDDSPETPLYDDIVVKKVKTDKIDIDKTEEEARGTDRDNEEEEEVVEEDHRSVEDATKACRAAMDDPSKTFGIVRRRVVETSGYQPFNHEINHWIIKRECRLEWQYELHNKDGSGESIRCLGNTLKAFDMWGGRYHNLMQHFDRTEHHEGVRNAYGDSIAIEDCSSAGILANAIYGYWSLQNSKVLGQSGDLHRYWLVWNADTGIPAKFKDHIMEFLGIAQLTRQFVPLEPIKQTKKGKLSKQLEPTLRQFFHMGDRKLGPLKSHEFELRDIYPARVAATVRGKGCTADIDSNKDRTKAYKVPPPDRDRDTLSESCQHHEWAHLLVFCNKKKPGLEFLPDRCMAFRQCGERGFTKRGLTGCEEFDSGIMEKFKLNETQERLKQLKARITDRDGKMVQWVKAHINHSRIFQIWYQIDFDIAYEKWISRINRALN